MTAGRPVKQRVTYDDDLIFLGRLRTAMKQERRADRALVANAVAAIEAAEDGVLEVHRAMAQAARPAASPSGRSG